MTCALLAAIAIGLAAWMYDADTCGPPGPGAIKGSPETAWT